MKNHQQLQDQEAMDSQESLNLETTHHHHSMKKSNLETTHNHQHVIAQMGCQENPNLETTHHHHFKKKSNPETTHNHQHVIAQMGCQENPNLETTTSNHHHVLIMAQMGCQENPNLETTHHHHSMKKCNLETTHHHHHVMAQMGCPNLETTSNHHQVPPSPSSSSQDYKRTHQVVKKTNEDGGFIKINAFDDDDQGIKKPNYNVSCSSLAAAGGEDMMMEEESGRERLKRHRVEMAGRVWIPDIWGHEDLLKDWIDCTVFDSSLGNNSIMSARAALVQEGRSTLRIQNQC